MLLTDFELAARLQSSYFTECTDSVMKRRVRRLAKMHNINPVYKTEDVWLFQEADFNELAGAGWDLNSQKEKAQITGKSRARSVESAFEKARALTKKT